MATGVLRDKGRRGIRKKKEPMSTRYEHMGCDQRNVTEKSKMERKGTGVPEMERIKTTVRLFGVGR